MKEPKVVVFVHSYLDTIRVGIQASHAQVKLVRKGLKEVNEWADKYGTVVWLLGGVTCDMKRIKRLVSKTTDLAWAEFREPDCGNMVTALAVLIPADYHVIPGNKGYTFFKILNNSKLAK